MESFYILFGYFTTVLIIPVVNWIKKKIPKDFPISTDIISGIISFIVIYVLKIAFFPELDTMTMLLIALGLWKVNGTAHALAKTVKKNKKG